MDKNCKHILEELAIIKQLCKANSELLLSLSQHIKNYNHSDFGYPPKLAPESSITDGDRPGYIN